MIQMERPRWWDGALWFRSYAPGGYDGYRTLGGRRLPCATMATALRRPDMRDEIRRLAARRKRRAAPPAEQLFRADDSPFMRAIMRQVRDMGGDPGMFRQPEPPEGES